MKDYFETEIKWCSAIENFINFIISFSYGTRD